MKITHHVPVDRLRLTDVVSPEYQREVDHNMQRAEARYQAAQRAVERAIERANDAEKQARKQTHNKRARRVWIAAVAEVEQRREELQRLASLVRASPASTEHRGDRSYRPIPKPGDVL